MKENSLTRNQKTGLIALTGIVAVSVLGAMTYLVPQCVKLIRDA